MLYMFPAVQYLHLLVGSLSYKALGWYYSFLCIAYKSLEKKRTNLPPPAITTLVVWDYFQLWINTH